MSDDRARVREALAGVGVVHLCTSLGLKGRRRSATKVSVPCPVHGGKDLNCDVAIVDGVIQFTCRSVCNNAGGDAFALVAAVRGLDVRAHFGEVLREAASIAGVAIGNGFRAASPYARPAPKPVDPAVEAHARELAEGRERVLSALLEICPLEGEGLQYMTSERSIRADVCRAHRVGFVADPASVRRVLLRGFSAEVLDELGVVYRGEHFAFDRHRLLVPILRNGRPVYVQGRSLGAVEKKHERWRSMRGGVPALWNHDALNDRQRPVMITEGAIDGLTALQWWPRGQYAVVGIFGAGGLKSEWCREMRGREVMLALDPDAAGDRGASKATGMLHAVGCEVKRLTMRDGRDLNDAYRAEVAA